MSTMARLKPIKDEGAVAFSLLHELVKEDLKARVEADRKHCAQSSKPDQKGQSGKPAKKGA